MQSTHLGPFTVWFEQSEEFHTIKSEVFSQHTYYAEFDTAEPIIIDAGAHIGLTTLYFKKNYPKSKIWSIEPIKSNFQLLRKNCETNGLSDVTLIHAALTEEGATTTLHRDASKHGWNSTAGKFSGAWNGAQITTPIEVPAVQLSRLIREINQPIDLLKMDIEGAETGVLLEALPDLRQVKQLIFEYHPRKEQSYPKLTEALQKNGFQIEAWQTGKPLHHLKTHKMFTVHGFRLE